MKYLLRVRERLFGKPLLLTPEYANVIVSALADRFGLEPTVGIQTVNSYVRPNDRPVLDRSNGIAIYPIVGSMVHRGDGVDASSGVQSYTAIQRDLSALMADSSVRGILLDLDTPGGEAAGLTELAEWIMEARKEKPIWGIANTSACSGGYWLGSACTKLYAAPMSSVGSIGVVTMHTDVSGAMERQGVVTTFIYAGKHKVDGNPLGPLPPAVKAQVQGHVDALYGEFVSSVAKQRGIDEATVRATEAGIFSPEQALELGLIDGIGTLSTTLNALNDALSRPYAPGATTEKEMSNTFVQADLDRARLEGVAEGAKTAQAGLTAALSTVLVGDARVDTFLEALNDGVAPATAAKFAAKVEAPKPAVAAVAPAAPAVAAPVVTRTAAAVDALLDAHAPKVGVDAAAGGEVDPKAARMAELSGSMQNFNAGRGYTPRTK